MFTKRVHHSWKVFSAAWTVFREIKMLWMLKLFSFGIITFIAAGFILPMYFTEMFRPPEIQAPITAHLLYYSLVMIVYLLLCFIIIFFHAAIVSATIMYFCGMHPTIGSSLRSAMKRMPQLFLWSLFVSLFGVVVRSVARLYRLHGKQYLGFAWDTVSWMAVPVLVVEGKYPKNALKQSGVLIQQKWGEKKFGNLMTVWPLIFCCAPVIVLVYAGFYYGGHQIGMMSCLLAGLYLMLMKSFHTLVHLIYQSVLYLYSSKNISPEGFSSSMLSQAFSEWI